MGGNQADIDLGVARAGKGAFNCVRITRQYLKLQRSMARERRTSETVLAVTATLAAVLEEDDPAGHVTASGVAVRDADESTSVGAGHHGGSIAAVVDNAITENIQCLERP